MRSRYYFNPLFGEGEKLYEMLRMPVTLMLFFFDETFRDSLRYPDRSLGALCGIAISEKQVARVANDIYQLKAEHLGSEFARDREIKGKELFKNWVFSLAAKGVSS